MTNSKRIVVTGASGFLGWNICKAAAATYTVFAVNHLHDCQVTGVTKVSCDLTDHKRLATIFQEIQPEAVIHAAAAADPNFCQKNPEYSRKINVDATVAIAELCTGANIPMVFTSSDLVFDGRDAPYNEHAAVCPVSLYGEQKAEAEQRIRAICQKGIICRMPLMYGDAPADAKSFIHPLITALARGTPLKLFTDEYRTTCSAADAARGLLAALDWMRYETLHLGGPERLSRFDIGRKLAAALGCSPDSIAPCLQKDVAMPAPRPADVSLDSSKAFSLGFSPLAMTAALPGLEIVKRNKMSPRPLPQDNT